MDTVGDADELHDGDEVPPRRPLVTTEGLAVTSLSTPAASLLVPVISQVVTLVAAGFVALLTTDPTPSNVGGF
jgi:hypothetical protein